MTDERQLLDDSMEMFSTGNDGLNPAPAQETPQEPAKTDAGPSRDDKGRFASPEVTQPAPAAQPTPQPVNADPDPEKQPITKAEFKGYLDEKAKRQNAEKEANDLRARIQLLESQQPAPQLPSFQDNPEALRDFIQREKVNTVFDVSETMAREKHGDDTVSTAMDWAMQKSVGSPAFAAEFLKQKHPIDWAVKQQKRDATLNEVGDDPDAYVRRRAAELGLIGNATPTQAAQPSPAASPQPASQQPDTQAPTRSIANATSAGGANVVPPAGEFAALEMFNR